MTLYEYYLVFPEGDIQELAGPIPISSFVDMNGKALPLPLPTNRMIAYQVAQKRTVQPEPGILRTYYLLEQLDANELSAYTY